LIDDALPRTTGRLVLRRFAARDLAAFQAYRCNPEVGRYQGWSVLDDAGATAFLGAMAEAEIGIPGEWFQIAVTDKPTDALVGDIGVVFAKDRAGVGEIGFSLAPSAQGRGLGTEAVRCALALLFESGRVDVVEGITDARNAPSIRLLQRVGMQLLRSQQALFKGETCTERVYAISRAQWREAATDGYQ
jgi:RimJ/RimL family protein N-acetyltransferase